MNYFTKTAALLLIAVFAIGSNRSFSQQAYAIGPDPEMKVSGTSTLHDWDMVSEEATGEATLRVSAGKVTTIQSAQISMHVTSLKSGKGQMDNNAYKALNASEYPEITFELLEANQDGGNDWKASGRLQIAGETRTVPFQLQLSPEDESISLSGTAEIKLTDFSVDPPTAVFGTIKTGDELTLHLKMKLNPIN
ncbi:YceI family protein [Cyclobacterium xiamenense]|jgi:hypothetical protein|uniref:YceI family protein n=1 Tax=Cyclobacterium xiamenense TaxID=1297121 RepID=UPI0012B9D271|nr:YceI family protein [Cyclobacterium xiamenense]